MGRRRRYGVMAFTDDGIENLKNLIAIHKDDPSIIEKRRQALAAMIKRKPKSPTRSNRQLHRSARLRPTAHGYYQSAAWLN